MWPSAVVWKIAIWALVLAIGVLELWAAGNAIGHMGLGRAGELSFEIGPIGDDSSFAITGLAPGGAMSAAGALVGDRVKFDSPGDSRRDVLIAGESIGMKLIHQGSGRHIALTIAPKTQVSRWEQLIRSVDVCSSVLALVLGGMIGLRRPESRSARFLALVLISTCALILTSSLPGGAVQNFAYVFINPLGFSVNYVAIVYFSFQFPHDAPDRVPAWLRRMAHLLFGLFACIAIVTVLERLEILVGSLVVSNPMSRALAISSSLLSIAGLLYSFRRAEGEMRQRVLWVALSLGLIFLTYASANLGVNQLIGDEVFTLLQLAAVVAGYLGLSYACLRLRVFDFSFAVNRALVYGVVSVALLVTFGVLEWLVHHLVDFEERQKNALVDAAVALALYLSFHKVRHTVEHFIEGLFFHQWHVKEAALRRFISQAAHITKANALTEAFGDALQRFCDDAPWALYRVQDDGNYRRAAGSMPEAPPQIDANEPMVLSLRAAPGACARGEAGSVLSAELALPMSHRGQLDGFVLLGRKARKTAYRPDEVAQLEFASHQIGLDLHALHALELKLALGAAQHQIKALQGTLDFARQAGMAMPSAVN